MWNLDNMYMEWEVDVDNKIVGLVHIRQSNYLIAVTETGKCSVFNLDNIISRSFSHLKQPSFLHTINIWDNLIDNWMGKFSDSNFDNDNKPYITGISSLSYNQFNNSYLYKSHQKFNNVLGDDEFKIRVSISTGESIGFNILKNSCLCCTCLQNYSEKNEKKNNSMLKHNSRFTCKILSRMSFLYLKEIIDFQKYEKLKQEDDNKKRKIEEKNIEQKLPFKFNPKVYRPCVAVTPTWPGNFSCYAKTDTTETGTVLLIGDHNQKLNENPEENVTYMTQTKDICHTLPGYIKSANPKDNEIFVSENLSKFLTSRSKSYIEKSKSCEILFISKEGIKSYNTVESTLSTFDINVKHKITLVDSYHGPKIENGFPRVYIRTNLKSIDNIHSNLNKSCEIIKNKYNESLNEYSSLIPVKRIQLEHRITALAAHQEYPYIIAGLSNDKITLIVPDWNKGLMKDIKDDEEVDK
jgi:hypothetical protein